MTHAKFKTGLKNWHMVVLAIGLILSMTYI